jgi:hypothetical protein
LPLLRLQALLQQRTQPAVARVVVHALSDTDLLPFVNVNVGWTFDGA